MRALFVRVVSILALSAGGLACSAGRGDGTAKVDPDGAATTPDGAGPRAPASDGAPVAGSPSATDPPSRDDGVGPDTVDPNADDATAGDPGGPPPGDVQLAHALLHVEAPARVATLVGSGAESGASVYGTDLGISYEHQGEHYMLFGDTWPSAESICAAEHPTNDDTLASVSFELLDEAVPAVLSFIVGTAADEVARTIDLLRGEESLSMGFGQVPMAAFSDGQRAFATFARLEPARCGESASATSTACPDDGFVCTDHLGECQPPTTAYTLVCDPMTQTGCYPGQECVRISMCMDPTSSQYDGTLGGESSSLAHETEIAVQREDDPTTFDSAFVLPTSKFANMTARTVKALGETAEGNDYAPGHGSLLVWGRPGFVGEHGREVQLYLMRHELPLQLDSAGKLRFQPRYFAGIDAETGEPTWSKHESEAAALALDGVLGGSPHEQRQIVNQMAVSWLGPPIDKWVMLYGGDLSPFLVFDPDNVHSSREPGAILLRFADHPWGPWSPPRPHLSPGSPSQPGDPYGPGGYIYSPECVDSDELTCAKSDPARPPDSAIPGCPVRTPELDPGRLYGVNIIDELTHPNDAGGLDFVWNVSTWNPYTVQLMRTRLVPLQEPPRELELSDAEGLRKLADWDALPELSGNGRYVQQSSRDRGTNDTSYPLSINGNRDFNNFHCASADAKLAPDQITPFSFDLPECEEDYVQGAVIGRIEGAGRLVRMWIGMLSLLSGPADDEVLRIYVDDDAKPRIEVPLRAALDGSAGEIFAPPFGAGSPRRLAWYYPVAFQRKVIVSLDDLGTWDAYYYHVDAVLDDAAPPAPVVDQRLEERDAAAAQLGALYRPDGVHPALGAIEHVDLAPFTTQRVERSGPSTVHELRVHVPESQLASLAGVAVSVRWDGAEEPAIELPLLELFASSRTPPDRPSAALSSFVEGDSRVLALKLPMPFASAAQWTFVNRSLRRATFELELLGEAGVPRAPFGHLHAQRSETLGPTSDAHHVVADLAGRGKLVGVCALVEGHADPAGGIQYDPLNVLEGDVEADIDGAPALWGTGTEEYADDVFYFADAPHSTAFVQAWGRVSDVTQSDQGEANLCRWHVLGTELDFQSSLDLSIELGGAGNPAIVDRLRTVAFAYLP